jgi:glycosyltransferase involved in cell wall biosynthesis
VLLDAYFQAHARAPGVMTLTVKTIRPLSEQVVPAVVAAVGNDRSIRVLEGLTSRDGIQALHAHHHAVLYPTRWDGFGLSCQEALHAGLPVVATDGWPMNELVTHAHNGLLVPARRDGSVRLAPRWEIDVSAMADAIVAIGTQRDLLRRLTCPDPEALVARQAAFRAVARARLVPETGA